MLQVIAEANSGIITPSKWFETNSYAIPYTSNNYLLTGRLTFVNSI